nr:uncharacterized protein LOC127332139 [Lolium perenne]
MEAGGRVGGVEDERNRKVAGFAGEEEVVGGEGGVEESATSAGPLRATVMDALGVGAATIGPASIGPVVEEPADLAVIGSATVKGDGDAGASTLAGVAVGAAVIGMAGQASNEGSLVKPDMQKDVSITCAFICFGLVRLIVDTSFCMSGFTVVDTSFCMSGFTSEPSPDAWPAVPITTAPTTTPARVDAPASLLPFTVADSIAARSAGSSTTKPMPASPMVAAPTPRASTTVVLKGPALVADSSTPPSPPTTSSSPAKPATLRFLSSFTPPTLPPASVAANSPGSAREETYTKGEVA